MSFAVYQNWGPEKCRNGVPNLHLKYTKNFIKDVDFMGTWGYIIYSD